MKTFKLLATIILCLLFSCTEDQNYEDGQKNMKVDTKAETASKPPVHRAPLYWSPYEACYTTDGYIPEAEWKENIDWVAENLSSYGYKMVCIDGWGDVDYNQYGYRTTHSQHWDHDYEWWAEYLRGKGMELGMYGNPLWVNMEAVNAGIEIEGTNIPLSNIVNTKENSTHFTWVQVDKEGAEEYVKGYINHYAQMGIKYLRVDFLSWYEVGIDKGARVGKTNRPRSHYETALRWMREECDRHGIFLSLVMPNLTNDGELETKYGDMIRINEDCATGRWDRFSELNRGIKFRGWSQYHTPMDGFAYFSKISGRNKVILDGDFIRINTYDMNDSHTDEKKTVISMHLMAGGPISIADRKSTIGENIWLYQNREMLALNEDGFVGKPLSSDPKSALSQVWTGHMSNGDLIVGLFNRENKIQKRNVVFSALGIQGYASVRDLWEHKDLGYLNEYSIDLAPHASVVLRIKASEIATRALPNSWVEQNIGNAAIKGIAMYDEMSNKFQIDAAGADIEGLKDEFNYIYQEISNNAEISGRLNSLDDTNPWAKAGLMIRSNLNQNASNAMIAMTPSNGISFQSRVANGGGTIAKVIGNIQTPAWLKLLRENSIFKAFYSTDNINWQQVGSDMSIAMSEKVYIGMAVTSHNTKSKTKAVFEDVVVKEYGPSIHPWRKLDIGAVYVTGSSNYNSELGQYYISGSGADIEGASDQFNFTYQELTGNVTLTSEVISLDNTNPWAKAGLMIRSSLNQNANNAMIAITPSNGVSFQHRIVNGGGTTGTIIAGKTSKIWLRIKKQGNQFLAFYSEDNIKWTQVGSALTISMADKVYVGMAVTSHDSYKLCNAAFRSTTID